MTGARGNGRFAACFLAALIFLPGLCRASRNKCHRSSQTETLEIGRSDHALFQLHVRNNVQGDLEILDDEPGSDSIRVEIEKYGPNSKVLDGIISSQTVFEEGRGNIYVLQVDYRSEESSVVPVVIGSVVGVIILLSLIVLCLWWMLRRNTLQGEQDFSPVTANQGVIMQAPVLSGSGSQDQLSTQGEAPMHGTCSHSHHSPGRTLCPPPPPPRRSAENIYSSQPVTPGSRGAGQGSHSPRAMSRTTLVTLSLVTCVSVALAAVCNQQPHVRILIYVPALIKLDSIQLFFNVNHKGLVFTDRWTGRNLTTLSVFDLDAVPLTRESPCTAESQCPSAYNQNLAGCDASSGKCVCMRGYKLSRGICVDIDECLSGLHACPDTATCTNLIGAYSCRCGYGYYGNQGTCRMCSVGCPTGLYESKPCTNTGDRSCSQCSACAGSQYEARPCRGNRDRECMHVAHPLLISGQTSTPTFLEGLKVEHSENVFTENLHSTRNLETTYYVTDNTQATDFFWVRESGLQVHIGIHNVQLIPEYEDVTHESDNPYILQSPQQTSQTAEEISKFKNVLRNYCRNPLPDHYSITVEIARDRITKAKYFKCDSQKSQKDRLPSCPENYNDGDDFLSRSINEACEKMGTFPEPMNVAKNSVVCTKNTHLLGTVFNQSYTPERPINFPSRNCRHATARCEQCLNQLRCKSVDVFEQQCCQIDCYTLRDCKVSASEECQSVPIECAMGDAYRYTIQPNFLDHFQRFQCHIRQRPPKVLYTLFFHIKVPGPHGPESELETPRVYKTINSHDFDHQGKGEYDADYISVEHTSGLNLKDEFILVGQDNKRRMNFSVYSMKQPHEFENRTIGVHPIASNVYVAKTQFSEPFAYSTSSWVKKDDCNKDISKFKSEQPAYKDDGQNVNVIVQTTDSPYQYFLKSVENPPYIRFMVPGNTSVLPWYFNDDDPELLVDDTLRVELELISSNRIWNIHISGQVTVCPAYVGITINDLEDDEEVFRYDTLVFCPKAFNITFNVPNIGRHPEKTFEVRLKDSKKTHQVFLTHLLFETTYVKSASQTDESYGTGNTPWATIAVIGTCASVMLLILHLTFVYLELTKVKAALKVRKDMTYYTRTSESVLAPEERDHLGSMSAGDMIVMCNTRPKLTQRQSAFIITYITFRIIYSLLFTFTVFLALLGLVLKQDLGTLSDLREFQAEKYNESRSLAAEIEKYGQNELLRQAKLVTSMHSACSNYIGELFDVMLVQVDNITLNLHQNQMYGPTTSISSRMHQWFDKKLDKYRKRVDKITENFQFNLADSLLPAMKVYRKYLKQIFLNEWFQFPQILYNISNFPETREAAFKRVKLSNQEANFGAFLPVEEVEQAQLWELNWWERYFIEQPYMPSLPVPEVNAQNVHCDHVATTNASVGITSLSSTVQHVHASRFMAPHLPGWSSEGLSLKTHRLKEEYKFLAPPEMPPYKGDLFDLKELKQHLSLQFVWVVFIVLDAILLVYRFSHTFMVAKSLYQGFEDTVFIGAGARKQGYKLAKAGEQREVPEYRQPGSSAGKGYTNRTSEYHMTEYMTHIDGQNTSLPPPPQGNCVANNSQNGQKILEQNRTKQKSPKRVHFVNNSQKVTRTSSEMCSKTSVLNCMQSPTVPKLVLGLVVLVQVVWIDDVISLVLSAEILSDLDGFRMFLVGLDVQVNRTNWYLKEQAKYYNNITMEIYRVQMKSELLHFQSMLRYFNAEQDRLVENYINEACAIKRHFLGNRTCDIRMSPSRLEVPMVPCNFIPIQPQLYDELDQHFSELQLSGDFAPYLSSARAIFLKFSYMVILLLALLLIIHVSGQVIFHYLKTRHKFPVHRVYVTSLPDVALETTSRPVTTTSDIESEQDEDDDEEDLKAYSNDVPESPEKLKGLLSSFKYSETKV